MRKLGYKDLQVTSTNLQGTTLINLIKNAASQISQGVEVETKLTVSDRFNVGASVAYVDAHFKSFRSTGPTATQQLRGQTTQDVSGRRPTYAPKYSGNLDAAYTLPVGGLELTVQGNTFFSSNILFADNLDPVIHQPFYARVDGQLILRRPGGGWELSLIGRNLTDHTIRTFGTNLPTSAGTYILEIERPRSVSLQLRYNF